MIRVGTGGTPNSAAERNNFSGIERIHELGLDAMEVEFTYGVRMGKGTAKKLKEHSQKNDVTLSIHGPYYINLNAREQKKRRDSEKRILDSCELGDLMGARNIVFHPGFYLGQNAEQVYATMYDELMSLTEIIEKNSWSVRLCPETTGKTTQFGSWEELTRLCSDVPGLGMAFDFSHVLARVNGKVDYDAIFKTIKKSLGQRFLSDLHMHFSGIEYTAKGEKRHLNLVDGAEPGLKVLVEQMKKWKIAGTAICESPNLEIDAIALKKML